MRKSKKKNKKVGQHQIFDNAFLSGCVWHKRLLIPLINEIFQKDIPLDTVIENVANEQYKPGTKAYDNNEITEIEYTNILLLCKDVVDVLSRDTDIQERLVDIMGNEILLTAEERGEVRGKKIGKEIGKAIGAFDMALENIKNAMESFALSFDEVCDKLKIKDREQYRSYIK